MTTLGNSDLEEDVLLFMRFCLPIRCIFVGAGELLANELVVNEKACVVLVYVVGWS